MILHYYSHARHMGGILIVNLQNKGEQMWHPCKLKKNKDCFRCDNAIGKGGNAYRPITNASNRMHRLCPSCVEKLLQLGEFKSKNQR
jgi:hypothetical protein